jgi:hypothetical protein
MEQSILIEDQNPFPFRVISDMDACDREICFGLESRHSQLDCPKSARTGRAFDDTAAQPISVRRQTSDFGRLRRGIA